MLCAFLPLCLYSQYPLGLGYPPPLCLGFCLALISDSWTLPEWGADVIPAPVSSPCSPDQLGVLTSAYWGLQPWPGPSDLVPCQHEPDKEVESPERSPPACLCQLEARLPACACKYLTYLLILPFVWVLWTQQAPPSDFREHRKNPVFISPWVKWQVRPVNRILAFSKTQLPVETCSPAAHPYRHRAWTGGGKMSIDVVCAPPDRWFYLKGRLDSQWESCGLRQGEQWCDILLQGSHWLFR